MDRAEVIDGTLRGQAFDLAIFGQGFGLETVSYNVTKQTGVAEKGAYQLRIVDQAGAVFAFTEGSAITLKTPQEMHAAFILQTPLEFGKYDLELTLSGENGDPVDTLRNGIVVEDPQMAVDGGMSTDQGTQNDLGLVPDTGGNPPTDAQVDAGLPPVDAGMPNKLGPWRGDYRYRREVVISNPSGADAPGGITIRIPIPHGDHVTAGRAEIDASDVALYWNSQELVYQWENRGILNSTVQDTLNELAMIAQIPATDPIGPGLFQEASVVLYFGDATASPSRNDSLFAAAERFDVALNNWTVRRWSLNCADRRGAGTRHPIVAAPIAGEQS